MSGSTRRADRDGVNVDVSDADGSSLDHQISDALRFLQAHEAELRRLRDELGRDAMCLDFGVWSPDVDELPTYSFPSNLLELAGGLGIEIELSFYPAEPDSSDLH